MNGMEALSDRENDPRRLAGLCGSSQPMLQLLDEMGRVARTESSILLEGESGSGKEHAARAIHALSAREEGPFVVVDCAALHPELALSELFGHARGAFSGAHADHPGCLERAHGGTLFLDEVGELPAAVQPVLLRALATHAFTRIGDAQVRSSSFRVIAASGRDLGSEVRAGAFRADLYYRLAAVVLRVPSLRERSEDIPALVNHFALQAGGRPLPMEPLALAALHSYDWPGNLRELRNAVERAIALGTEIQIPQAGSSPVATFHQARQAAVEAFERAYLKALLERHQGSTTTAAREAGMAQSYFYRLLKKHRLHGKRARAVAGARGTRSSGAPSEQRGFGTCA